MKAAYLECFAGVSGDMLLGALVQTGVPLAFLKETAAALNVGLDVSCELVDRSGISAMKVHVLASGRLAEEIETSAHDHSHSDTAASSHNHLHSHSQGHLHSHSLHELKSHGRSLSDIEKLINNSELDNTVKEIALEAFNRLGAVESKIHNVSIDNIHFHEVGGLDAIGDIVLCSAASAYLGIEKWLCSPLNVGSGMVKCRHGLFPVPAPATAELLLGVPTYSMGPAMELVTPTGAALLRAFECTFGDRPNIKASAIGYGAGTRNPPGFPNVLRLSLINSINEPLSNSIAVLETSLDDQSPQITAYVCEKALAMGALEVFCTTIQMKKNRTGTLVTILCEHADIAKFENLLFTETTTLGLRKRTDQRSCLSRESFTVSTPWGDLRLKIGKLNDQVVNVAPEFEDAKTLAETHGIPLKMVLQKAIAIYFADQHEARNA